MTRAEHMKWAKDRALEYARAGQLDEAVASLASDLGKHPDTFGHIGLTLLFAQPQVMTSQRRLIEFIEGFN